MTDESNDTIELPNLLNYSAYQRVYQQAEVIEDGAYVEVKLQATRQFKDKLNKLIYDALQDCIEHCLNDGRRTLDDCDVPTLIED